MLRGYPSVYTTDYGENIFLKTCQFPRYIILYDLRWIFFRFFFLKESTEFLMLAYTFVSYACSSGEKDEHIE